MRPDDRTAETKSPAEASAPSRLGAVLSAGRGFRGGSVQVAPGCVRKAAGDQVQTRGSAAAIQQGHDFVFVLPGLLPCRPPWCQTADGAVPRSAARPGHGFEMPGSVLCAVFAPEAAKPGVAVVMTDVARWVGFISSRDGALLGDLLHPEVVLETPFNYPPQRGRDLVQAYLLCSMRVLCGPGFGYIGQWNSREGAVLEFESVIDGIRINGVDILRFDGGGRITHFQTMVRPLRALEMLSRLMVEQLRVEDAGA